MCFSSVHVFPSRSSSAAAARLRMIISDTSYSSLRWDWLEQSQKKKNKQHEMPRSKRETKWTFLASSWKERKEAGSRHKKSANFVLHRHLNLPCVPAAASCPHGKLKNICIYRAPTGLAEQRLRLRWKAGVFGPRLVSEGKKWKNKILASREPRIWKNIGCCLQCIKLQFRSH